MITLTKDPLQTRNGLELVVEESKIRRDETAGLNRDCSRKRSAEKQHTITSEQHCPQSQQCHSEFDPVFIPLLKRYEKYHLRPVYPIFDE